MQKVKIGIVGLGGIGGFLGVLLSDKKYEVFTTKIIKKNSIFYLKSKYYGNLKGKIKSDKSLKYADVIFVCSKYPYLKNHLRFIKNRKAIVIPFLNGLSHIEILKKKFGNRLFISNIGKVVSKKKRGSNIIVHESNNGAEVLICFRGLGKNMKKKIIKIFENIKVKIKILKSNHNVIWTKLIRLSALSAMTSLYNCNLGIIRKSKIKTNELNNLLKESIEISKKIFKNDYTFNKINKTIQNFPDTLTTSLQRDINLKLKSELDSQIGSLVKLSKKYNVYAPNYKKIYAKLKKK